MSQESATGVPIGKRRPTKQLRGVELIFLTDRAFSAQEILRRQVKIEAEFSLSDLERLDHTAIRAPCAASHH
jgi:hypothetical protein